MAALASRARLALLLVALARIGAQSADDAADADVAAAKSQRQKAAEAVQRALDPQPGDATHEHENGTAVTRYEFHSELVFIDKEKGPDRVRVYRTKYHDMRTKGLPSCAVVDGWYLSLNGLPFWPVENVPTGLPAIAAACDFRLKDWPDGKNIRDEVPRDHEDMIVVFSKEKPPDQLYWKSEL